MKIRLFVAGLLAVCLLVPMALQAQTDNSRMLIVSAPANCQPKINRQVRNNMEENVVQVKCDSKETSSTGHSEFPLDSLEAKNGWTIMVHVPSGYTFSTATTNECQGERIHVTIRRLAKAELLPEVKDDHMEWYLWWYVIKCTLGGKCGFHPRFR